MKSKMSLTAFVVAAAVALIGWPSVARAQNTPASLTQQLTAYYKLTKLGTDSSGSIVTEAGSVLVVQKGGILSVPPGLFNAVSIYKDGAIHPPKGAAILFGNNTHYIAVGEKLYALKIEANFKNERVSMNVMQCDTCNGANQPSSFKAWLQFQFPKDFLESADVGQVEDLIGQVFTIDQGDTGTQPQADNNSGSQAPAAANQPSASPAAPPPSVKLGMTFDEVKNIKGQPIGIAEVGAKTIYSYADMKIIFMNGKVTDVQ